MSFLKNLSRDKKCAESVILVDIAVDSVAGAYARYEDGQTPVLIYTRRLPIEVRPDEPREKSMLRTLETLSNDLVREGAPTLLRATGSGSAEMILLSIDTPWQETKVRTELFERKDPFVFTKSIVANALEKTSVTSPEKLLADESIVGSILNGYETHDPYGKKVHRAAIIVLTSLINKEISDSIISMLGSVYHTKNILPIAGSSLRYQAMRTVFPHESEALILDATGPLTSISLIRKSLFVALAEVPNTTEHPSWLDMVMGECTELAQKYPLPRTIFLLARESEIPSVQDTLAKANFGSLWLSDNPPKIVSVLASHIVGLVRQATDTPPDLQLLLMALYYQSKGNQP